MWPTANDAIGHIVLFHLAPHRECPLLVVKAYGAYVDGWLFGTPLDTHAPTWHTTATNPCYVEAILAGPRVGEWRRKDAAP